MSVENIDVGSEFSLLESWDGWDEVGVSDLQFYKAKLKESAWPADVYAKHKDGDLLITICHSISTVELFNFDISDEEPVYTAKIKLVLE